MALMFFITAYLNDWIKRHMESPEERDQFQHAVNRRVAVAAKNM